MKPRLIAGLAIAGVATLTASLSPALAEAGNALNTHGGHTDGHRTVVIDGKRAILGTPDTSGSRQHPDPETSALEKFSSQVQTFGDSKYSTTFAGARIAAGKFHVYVLARHDSAFLKAVAEADSAKIPYTVTRVDHSWAAQMATRNEIAAQVAQFGRQGIALKWWGPDSEADAKVEVALTTPTGHQLSMLRAAVARLRSDGAMRQAFRLPRGTGVALGTYTQVAAAVLTAELPAPTGITVLPKLGGPIHTTAGDADSSPFFGGDEIWYETGNVEGCGGGFSVNSGSTQYEITAAHCTYPYDGLGTGHDWYTCHTESGGNCTYSLGEVNSVWWNNNRDFELVSTTAVGKSALGYTWINRSGNAWSMNGYEDPAVGGGVTSDGGESGAIYGNTVINADTCLSEEYAPNEYHTVCNAVNITNNGISPCVSGDSGGPIVERESNPTNAYAVAIIDGGDSGSCFGQLFSSIRNTANVGLIWGS